ncbi:MAG: hypothetical protein R3E08_09015 [Thiotrichaceae bacterium]
MLNVLTVITYASEQNLNFSTRYRIDASKAASLQSGNALGVLDANAKEKYLVSRDRNILTNA